MRTFLPLLLSIVFSLQAAAIPFPIAKAGVIEGKVTAYVWMNAIEFEDAEEGIGGGDLVEPRYFIKLKAPNLPQELIDNLTLCARGAIIKHPILFDDPDKGEVIIVVPSCHVKGLNVGSNVKVTDYEIFRDDSGCASKCKSFLIDGKKPTPSGGPSKYFDTTDEKPNESEQAGADQPATRPEAKVFGSAEKSETTVAERIPAGIAIELMIDKMWGPGRPIVLLKNHTDKPIQFVQARNQGWKIKVFDSDGKLIGKAGFDMATEGSFQYLKVLPGESGSSILDIRWGVLNDKDIPDICRVEIETPDFYGPNKELSAKLSAYLRLRADDPPLK